VPLGERAHIERAELGMVAAAPLRDVVIDGGHVEQPAALETRHELGAQRKLVRELRHGEAAQVAHHHEDVLVHRVDVKKVVLHLSHDAAELGQVVAEDAVLVHAPELVHDAARLLQDVQKQELRHGIGAERIVDRGARAP
jgi:hypothetical protein